MTQEPPPTTIRGRVIKGDQRGRALGFPTMNLQTLERVPPGVYAGRVMIDGRAHPAAIHAGQSPTFAPAPPVAGRRRFLIEAYLLDYAGEAYGKEVLCEFTIFLRPTRAFDDADALARQIALDVQAAKTALEGDPA
ncbi:MAG: riboflavin kinase [Planctomycetota bacterium]